MIVCACVLITINTKIIDKEYESKNDLHYTIIAIHLCGSGYMYDDDTFIKYYYQNPNDAKFNSNERKIGQGKVFGEKEYKPLLE